MESSDLREDRDNNTERKGSEDKLRAQADLLQLTHDAILVRELDGTILYWNRGAWEMYGFTEQQAIGQKSHDLLRTKFPKPLDEIEQELLLEGRWDGELTHSTIDDRTIVVASRWALKTDAQGQPSAVMEINNDISGRKEAEDRLIRANEELELRVQARTTELVLLNKELAAARDQAQSASRLKSEFVANMSHEIRTPMNGIIGMCNVLLKTNLDERQRECAHAVKEAGNTLLVVINDILDFSKIEAGKIELEVLDFDPVRLVEGACELLATQASAKKLELMAFIDPSLAQILRGDPERLRQVLTNFLSNAIKFSERGQVVVRAVGQSEQDNSVNVRFSVTDKGIGIGEEEQQRLFQPFVQADGSITRRFGGTGLGLSISKHLVKLMDGTIGVESVKGEGSTFWFVVPLERRMDVPIISLRDELRNVRVLITDDDSNSREILHSYLLSWGLRNGAAVNAQETLRMLRQAYLDGDPYRVAILDLSMPDTNGIDLAREIMGDPAISQTKLILFTAYDAAGLGRQAIELGFKAYITKPVRQSQLLNCLLAVVCGTEPVITKSAADARGAAPKVAREGLILIAEDHPINQQVAQMYLDELGFASHIVSTGTEAVTATGKNYYSLVLMDCQMPGMDGFAATSAIRKAEALTGRKTPIIAVTAHAMEGDRDRCIAAGMDDYISKPVDPDELKRILERWIPASQQAGASFLPVETHEGVSASVPIDIPRLRARFDSKAARTLVDMFISSTPDTLDKISDAIVQEDCANLAALAHYLKGPCGTIYATKMKDLCSQLEKIAEQGDTSSARTIHEQLRTAFHEVKQYIDTHLLDDVASDNDRQLQPRHWDVLLVEDDRSLNIVMSMQLSHVAGVSVRSASDGQQAMRLIREQAPDLMILDLSLPGLNGFEIIEGLL